MPGTVKARGERAGKPLSYAERAIIVQALSEGKDPSKIAMVLGRNVSTIQRFKNSMIDSTAYAKAIFKHNAATLAERVVEKANVREALDVLSRPDIGVIAPPVGSGGVGGSFGVSVSVSTLGTVVQVAGGSGVAPLPPADARQLPIGSPSDAPSEGRLLGNTINIPPEQVEALQRSQE